MAASNINSVVVTGNLTRDPELRHTPGGTPVCKLRIAVNTRRKSGDGNWEDKPNYFDVTVWGAQGENCSTYLVKGRPVAISGRLEWREWEGGRQQAPGGRDHRRDGAVPRQPRRLRAAAATATAAAASPAATPAFRPTHRTSTRRRPRRSARRPTTTSRSRPQASRLHGRRLERRLPILVLTRRPCERAAHSFRYDQLSSQERGLLSGPQVSSALRAGPVVEPLRLELGLRPAPRRSRRQARRAHPPAQVHEDQLGDDRLQGPHASSPLPLGPRQGPLPPRHRPFPPAPARARACREEGA